MAYILCIETATEICSVALLNDGSLVTLEENDEGNTHASHITILIEAVIKKAGIELKQLNAIAVSKGPGSYTGLRVGVSTAKGLCYALDIPLIAINTLESLSQHPFLTSGFTPSPEFRWVEPRLSTNFMLCPMLDARRMEVYCALFDDQLNMIRQTEAKIIDANSFARELNENNVYFFGNGAPKCKGIITHQHAIFIDGIKCSAATMTNPAIKAFTQNKFEDIAYFEPFYLKDFAGIKPGKK